MRVRAGLAAAGAVVALAAGAVGWQQETVVSQARVPDPSPLDGAALFRAKGCASCHDGPDTTSFVGGFPSLADAPGWAGDRRPGLSAEEYLTESIRAPGAFTSPEFQAGGGPTMEMPDLGLSVAEVESVVAYLLGD